MGSSLVGFYTTSNTFPMENFNHGWKNDMVANMATIFARGALQRSSFLGNLKPLIQETWPLENSNLMHFFYCFSILSVIPIVPSNNLNLG
jgi:hypothetical protein